MSLGLALLTFVHVALSLVGIGSGAVVLNGLLTSRRLDRWTAVFLTTTVATSVTGFLFPFTEFLPSHAVGAISLVVLAIAIPARYTFGLGGKWRGTYVVTSVLALYLNVFVLIVQLFQKAPSLRALAPFAATQLVVLIAFVAVGILAAVRFRPDPVTQADRSVKARDTAASA
jgi:hypothetical protein